MLSVNTILHPTDFSECSKRAFQLACTVARDTGARLVVLHVVEIPEPVSGVEMLSLPNELNMEPMQKRLEELHPDDPKIKMERRLVRGVAPDQVLKLAEEIGADAIILGTHGRTGLARLLMGSVAEQVTRKAVCPVITIRSARPKT
jgi:nucleotide-binding universal stress UspA family protein